MSTLFFYNVGFFFFLVLNVSFIVGLAKFGSRLLVLRNVLCESLRLPCLFYFNVFLRIIKMCV